MIAAVAAILGVLATVFTTAYTLRAQRAAQQQTDFTAASQQLAAADTFSQAAGITTLATLAKNDPTTYREPVCQIVQPYITQAVSADSDQASKVIGSAPAPTVDYRPGVLLAIQNISPKCPKWEGLGLTRWSANSADLHGANMAGAQLQNATLTAADLTATNLHNATLAAADLTATNLHNATLAAADLSRAHLSRAHLDYAALNGANLTNADARGANLTSADFSHANLSDTNLYRIKYNMNTKWPDGFVPPPNR